MHNSELPTISGTGYLTLDVIIEGKKDVPTKVQAGGSFGNVLTISSFLGSDSYPIARLDNNIVSEYILNDLKFWGVHLDFIKNEENGSSPVLIHRVLADKTGNVKHKFEFKNPINGEKFPSYRPYLKADIEDIEDILPLSKVFYFDRVNRSAISLAKRAKENGSIIFFEPSSNSYSSLFEECLAIADILKFSKERMPDYKFRFRKRRCELEIETNGKSGLTYRTKFHTWKSIGSTLVSKVVDTVGAGDWCSAGIINVLASRKKIDLSNEVVIIEALNYGQVLGGINCMFLGARGAMYNLPVKFYKNLKQNLKLDSIYNDVNNEIVRKKRTTQLKAKKILQMI